MEAGALYRSRINSEQLERTIVEEVETWTFFKSDAAIKKLIVVSLNSARMQLHPNCKNQLSYTE